MRATPVVEIYPFVYDTQDVGQAFSDVAGYVYGLEHVLATISGSELSEDWFNRKIELTLPIFTAFKDEALINEFKLELHTLGHKDSTLFVAVLETPTKKGQPIQDTARVRFSTHTPDFTFQLVTGYLEIILVAPLASIGE